MKSERYAFILIADKKYWQRLCERNKAGSDTHVFVRKNKVGPISTKKLLFYVKKPVMQIRGVADFVERLTGKPEELWRSYGSESCFDSFEELCEFTQGRKIVTFLRFRNFFELENPKSAKAIRSILGSLQGFRGGYVDSTTAGQLIT